MYWYMTTNTPAARPPLLTDEVWSQIPRTTADRRTVAAALVALACIVPAIVAGSASGILEPRLGYEGGSATAHANTHTITISADISNHSARSWKITGATVNAPGTAHSVETAGVDIPAHSRRTFVGVVHVDNCAAVPAARNDPATDTTRAVELRVQRLLGTTAFTARNVFGDDLVTLACRS
jgi:hypothetical protein